MGGSVVKLFILPLVFSLISLTDILSSSSRLQVLVILVLPSHSYSQIYLTTTVIITSVRWIWKRLWVWDRTVEGETSLTYTRVPRGFSTHQIGRIPINPDVVKRSHINQTLKFKSNSIYGSGVWYLRNYGRTVFRCENFQFREGCTGGDLKPTILRYL